MSICKCTYIYIYMKICGETHVFDIFQTGRHMEYVTPVSENKTAQYHTTQTYAWPHLIHNKNYHVYIYIKRDMQQHNTDVANRSACLISSRLYLAKCVCYVRMQIVEHKHTLDNSKFRKHLFRVKLIGHGSIIVYVIYIYFFNFCSPPLQNTMTMCL